MKSLEQRHRELNRKVQTAVLLACLALMAVLVAVMYAQRGKPQELYTDRVDYTQPVRSDGPDGRYLESYHEGHFGQSVLFMDFVPTGIRICGPEGETLWEMKGRVVNSLFWSPDGRYAAVSCRTAERGWTLVVDTETWTETELTPPAEAVGEQVYYYAVAWDEEGLLLCWDYGDRRAQGRTVWNP